MAADDETTTICFVDDSATDRVRGTGLIRKSHPDWQVIAVASAREALQHIGESMPDVVVTDLVMPEMDGKQLLKSIRESYPSIPVVLITAQGDDSIAAECVGLGAVNYVPKRLLAEKLVPVLDEVIHTEKELHITRSVLKHIQQNRCQLEIDSDLNQIRSLVNFVRERLHAMQLFSGDRVQKITTAVRESLLNAHFHGNLQVNSRPLELPRSEYIARATARKSQPEFADRRIRLTMSLQPEAIRFHIEDDGPGFDRSFLQTLSGPPQDEFSNGNGVRHMQMSMESVRWNESGNAVTMTGAVGRFSGQETQL